MGDITDTSKLAVFSMTTPYMTRETFAAHVGLPVGVIEGWIERGYIPTTTVGKYSLVNIALLAKRALGQEFSL